MTMRWVGRFSCTFMLLCVVALGIGAPTAAWSQSSSGITVAAAADLTDPLKEIVAGFEQKTGAHVRLVFGSSGNLTAQIRNGAPFDVFLSADVGYPDALVKDGLADGATLSPYAVGALAVLVPARSDIALDSRGMNSLLDPSVKRISIANPVHAPYGRAAEQLLKALNLYGSLQPKLVLGENVAQAAQFVISGNAQAGIVSRAQALVAARGGAFRYWEPPSVYPPITQGAVVLSHSAQPALARSFLEYLKSEQGAKVLTQYGYATAAPGKVETGSPSKKHR
jgi:molybdate transport system substrate-binding protein